MEQLRETDFSWHAHQPDVPDQSAEEMKAFFDAPVRTLMRKINEIIDDGSAESLMQLALALREHGSKLLELEQAAERHDGQIPVLERGVEGLGNQMSELESAFDRQALAQQEQGTRLVTLEQDAERYGGRLDQMEQVNESQWSAIDSLSQSSGAALPAGLRGSVETEAVPMGLSYAAEQVYLSYLADAETGSMQEWMVPAGSVLLKATCRAENYDTGAVYDDAVQIYIFTPESARSGDFGGQYAIIMTKVCPLINSYGLQYTVEELSHNVGQDHYVALQYPVEDESRAVLTVDALRQFLEMNGYYHD